MEAETLKQLIRRSFAVSNTPPGSRIAASRPDVAEMEAIERSFAPWTWQSAPRELLLSEQGALLAMTPAGLQRFLPAYLLLSLDDFEKAGALADSALFLFLPTARARERLQSIYRSFSFAQLQAIREYLQFVRDQHAEEFEIADFDAAIRGLSDFIGEDAP